MNKKNAKLLKGSKATASENATPWNELSQRQRDEFSKDFLTNHSRLNREAALKPPRKLDHDHIMVMTLRLYHRLIQERKTQSATISDAEIEVRGWVNEWLLEKVLAGKWDALHWLADYGKQHCKAGLGSSKQSLPSLDDLCNDSNQSGDHLASVILREFTTISGIKNVDLFKHIILKDPLPPYDGTRAGLHRIMTHRSPPVIPEYLCRCRLPTKAFLKKRSLIKWQRLVGAKPANPDSLYSRTLKRLGLSGLPVAHGKPKQLDPDSLNTTGNDFWDYLKD